MEAMEGACFLDEEWESLYKIFSVDRDLDFADLLGHNPNHFYQSNSTSDHIGSSNGSANYVNTQVFSAGEQISSLLPFDHFLVENGLLMGPLSDDHTPEIERPSIDQIDGPDDHKKRKCSDEQIETEEDEAPLPKKRARVSKHAEKGKRKMQEAKKNVQNSGCDASDNESNASQEVVKETPNINGKKRASRGAATDPQSLYARRRRERINERLRILQNLVPNGTKVDISTMLEEAVNYVKFLQLQIKLLSSDEMWMYAPLAYNGFDVGFYKKFSPYLQWP